MLFNYKVNFQTSRTPSVSKYKQKKLIFFVPNYKQKRLTFIVFNYVFSKNYLFQRKIKCKVHSICSLFYFLYNQLPMKIVFTSSYKTYFKDNTKNYVINYYVLVFLISVIFFSSYNIGWRKCIRSISFNSPILNCTFVEKTRNLFYFDLRLFIYYVTCEFAINFLPKLLYSSSTECVRAFLAKIV